MTKGVPRPRETLYPKVLRAAVTEDLARRVERAAERHGVGKAAVTRASIERGLPLYNDAMRKAAKAAGNGAGKEPAK